MYRKGIDNTTIYTGKTYSTNFTVDNKRNYLSLNYNGDNSYLFVNGKEVINFKPRNFEIEAYPLCTGGLSKEFGVGYMRATGLNGYAYDFSVDYWTIANDKILNIHKYLTKKKKDNIV